MGLFALLSSYEIFRNALKNIKELMPSCKAPDFNQMRSLSTDFRKSPDYQISQKKTVQ
jgi:hypothetical protein